MNKGTDGEVGWNAYYTLGKTFVDDPTMRCAFTHAICRRMASIQLHFHVICHKFFGFGKTHAWICTLLPLLLKPDGNGKLSKRDGENWGSSFFSNRLKNQERRDCAGVFENKVSLPDAFRWISCFLGLESRGMIERFSNGRNWSKPFRSIRIGKSGTKLTMLAQNGTMSSTFRAIVHLLIADFLICWCSSSRTPSINGKKAKRLFNSWRSALLSFGNLWAQGKFSSYFHWEHFDDDIASRRNGIQTR